MTNATDSIHGMKYNYVPELLLHTMISNLSFIHWNLQKHVKPKITSIQIKTFLTKNNTIEMYNQIIIQYRTKTLLIYIKNQNNY